jgi:hypothetical protein
MAYLHEQRMAQARKMLYMLGNTKHKSQEHVKVYDEAGEAVGSAQGMGKSQADDLKMRQALAARKNLETAKFDKSAREETEDVSNLSDEDYKTYLNDVSVISGKGPRDFAGPAMPQGVNWGEAQTRLKLNDQADMAPVGGSFTQKGGEAFQKESDSLTSDFHTADALHQQGALMNQQANASEMMAPQGMMGTKPMRFGGF